MDKLNFHPKAIENFNNIALDIFNNLIISKKNITQEKTVTYDNEYITTINPDDIIDARSRTVDYFGEKLSLDFVYNNNEVTIDKNNYENLKQLSEKISGTSNINPFLSRDYIENKLVEWIQNKLKSSENGDFIEYLTQKAALDIKKRVIWIPLPSILISTNIKIGEVTLKKFDENLCDYWKIHKIAKIEELRKIHNQTFADITVIAESIRACEIAENKIENTLRLLSLFSPAAFDPRALSFCSIYRKNTTNSLKFMELDDTYKRIKSSESIISRGTPFWEIDDSLKQMILYYMPLIEPLLSNPLNDFQKVLFDSIYYFSKSTLVSDFSDKLVYILVALETLLLSNSSSPIQDTISRRLAFFLGKDINSRKKIIRIFKKTYDLRSKFIHHGKTIQDLETFKEFLEIARSFFMKLLINQKKYENLQELVDEIDNKSLS